MAKLLIEETMILRDALGLWQPICFRYYSDDSAQSFISEFINIIILLPSTNEIVKIID